ncbi:MAG: DivIVA domain-containing protein [Solirubrobacterales bacterium]
MVDQAVVTFRRALFGYKPEEVIQEIQRLQQLRIEKEAEYRAQVEQAHAEQNKLLSELGSLREQLDELRKRERGMLDVLARAQSNASSIEEQARSEAMRIITDASREMEQKQYQLARLHDHYFRFRQDFVELLQRYSASIPEAASSMLSKSFEPGNPDKDKNNKGVMG